MAENEETNVISTDIHSIPVQPKQGKDSEVTTNLKDQNEIVFEKTMATEEITWVNVAETLDNVFFISFSIIVVLTTAIVISYISLASTYYVKTDMPESGECPELYL